MLEFSKHRGASMINVLVFFTMAMMVSAQIFFFSKSSMDTAAAQSEAESRRFLYEKYLHDAIEAVRNPSGNLKITSALQQEAAAYSRRVDTSSKDIKAFYEQRKTSQHKEGNNVCYDIYDLNYTLLQNVKFVSHYNLEMSWNEHEYKSDNLPQIVFPPMGENYYLIRVYEKYTSNFYARQKLLGRRLMYQAVVYKNGTNTPSVISFQEVWY